MGDEGVDPVINGEALGGEAIAAESRVPQGGGSGGAMAQVVAADGTGRGSVPQ